MSGYSYCPIRTAILPSLSRIKVDGMIFMPGLPINRATKIFCGSLYSISGIPTCCSYPLIIMATLSPKVIASDHGDI